METIAELKTSLDDFSVEYEVSSVAPNTSVTGMDAEIEAGINSVDFEIEGIDNRIAKLNTNLDCLTSHADGFDYAIAVTCGVITGIFDATIVGSWDYKNAKAISSKEINQKVIAFAKKDPEYETYCNFAIEGKAGQRKKVKDGDRLDTAIGFLEHKFHLPGDSDWNKGKFGIDANTHRLDDFCHHPTLMGLVCCVLVQFSEEPKSKYINKHGELIESIPITVNEYGNFCGKNPVSKLFAGVINWFITCAKTIANRKGHLMSDYATPAGIPGSMLSMIEELASLPCFRKKDFYAKLRDAYKNGIGSGKDQMDLGNLNILFEGAKNKFDITTEKAIGYELKKQALPVIINDVLVRGVYFIRRLIDELKEKHDLLVIVWKNVIPFDNRTIVRMLTISTATFSSIDMADAAIHAATHSVDGYSFGANMLLRVNFIGVGRFAIAISTDAVMGGKKLIKNRELINLQAERLTLLNAKVSYKQADMWLTAESAGKTLEEAYKTAEASVGIVSEAICDIGDAMPVISDKVATISEANPDFADEMKDILEWS